MWKVWLFDFPENLIRNTEHVKFVPTEEGLLALVKSKAVLTALLQYPSRLVQSTETVTLKVKLKDGIDVPIDGMRVLEFRKDEDGVEVRLKILKGGERSLWKILSISEEILI